ncbi:hypothetical protein Hamer_G026119 [Homarus americanus]|uniref:Uncharacterized protein n=1 Tax=Homarus americanus TaxID=6706 RepID=A0A8J5T7V7_HOMAM|nr:hypothetical protein Hamer_G026119 [Homarus americanus]
MSGRRVILLPPGPHRDLTRGPPCSQEPVLVSCSATPRHRPAGEDCRGVWRGALSRFLVPVLLLLSQSSSVQASKTGASLGAQLWPLGKPQRFPPPVRLHHPLWKPLTSPSLMVSQTPPQEPGSGMLAPPTSTVINIWDIPPTSTPTLAHGAALTSVGSSPTPAHDRALTYVGSSLLLTKVRSRGQTMWGGGGQRRQETSSCLYHNQLDSGEGCLLPHLSLYSYNPSLRRHKTDSSPLRSEEDQSLESVDDQAQSGEEDQYHNSGDQRHSGEEDQYHNSGDQRHTGGEDQPDSRDDYTERSASRPTKTVSRGALKSNKNSEVVNWRRQRPQEGAGTNIWVSQGGNKPGWPRGKNPWPFLPGTQTRGYNRDEIRANLDSDETCEGHRVDLLTPAAVIDNTILQEAKVEVYPRYGGNYSTQPTSLRAPTLAQTPHYFSVIEDFPEGNEIPGGSFIPSSPATRAGPHPPRSQAQLPSPQVQLSHTESLPTNDTRERQTVVVEQEEDEREEEVDVVEEDSTHSAEFEAQEDLGPHSGEADVLELSVSYDLKSGATRQRPSHGGPEALSDGHLTTLLHRHKRKTFVKVQLQGGAWSIHQSLSGIRVINAVDTVVGVSGPSGGLPHAFLLCVERQFPTYGESDKFRQ